MLIIYAICPIMCQNLDVIYTLTSVNIFKQLFSSTRTFSSMLFSFFFFSSVDAATVISFQWY